MVRSQQKSMYNGWFIGTLAAALAVVALGLPAEVSADDDYDYYFGEECSEVDEYEPEEYEGAAHLILDRSGSMDFNYGQCGPGCAGGGTCPLWDVALCAIDTATAGMEDEIMFGFGLFPYRDSWCFWSGCSPPSSEPYDSPLCPGGECDASHDVDHDYYTHSDISQILGAGDAGGGTPTDEALMLQRDQYANTDDNLAGVMITDGFPNDSDGAIEEACNNREAGMVQYIVGLGGETDQEYNDIQAAAASTGCCGDAGDDLDCSQGVGSPDPCDDDVDWSSDIQHDSSVDCTGSWQANNVQEFENLLAEIGDEVQCTFPVEDEHWPDGVPDDPDVAKIQLQNSVTGEWEEIPHVNQDDPMGGWEFANESRNQITISGDYCDQLGADGGSGNYREVRTQLACSCYSQYEGQECPCTGDITEPPYNTPGNTACPTGEYECEDAKTEPSPPDDCDNCGGGQPTECPFHCDPDDEVDGMYCDPDCEVMWNPTVDPPIEVICDGEPMTEEDAGEDAESRCDAIPARIGCEPGGSTPMCDEEEGQRPMPEVCDGLDNSCDGQVSNISETWDKWLAGEPDGSPDDCDDGEFCFEEGEIEIEEVPGYPDDVQEGAACFGDDACSCVGEIDADHVGSGDSEEEEFFDYIRNFDENVEPDQGCQCIPD